MARGFRWLMGDFVGGSYAVHQAYKPWLAIRGDTTPVNTWTAGEISIQARDTTDIVRNGFGFEPSVLFLIGYRPRLANLGSDSAFGARGGGYTFGVAGHAVTGPEWDSVTTYDPGDVVRHENVDYVATSTNTNSEPPSGDWDEVPLTQFTGSSRIRHAFETNYSYWNEDCCYRVVHDFGNTEILQLEVEFDTDGFTLHQVVNLYDQADPIYWLAIGGNYQAGVITTGDTSIIGFDGQPQGAVFFSTKHTAGVEFRNNYWDHMQGFASIQGSQAAIWGGAQPTSWSWTTERWQDDACIVLCTPAAGSSFVGASYDVGGIISSWNVGGVSFQWPVYGNQLYRVGYVLTGEPCDSGVLETNYETRPGGSQNDFPDGSNFVPTDVRPDIILMQATNYNFSYSDTDPFNYPRSPNQFGFGGSGGFGWHVAPFVTSGVGDAWSAHTFGNAVAERGRYANSGTQLLRNYILAGQGSNSSPPAYHQHSVNVIPNPVIVGINYRYAERHAQVKRIHVNVSDQYLP